MRLRPCDRLFLDLVVMVLWLPILNAAEMPTNLVSNPGGEEGLSGWKLQSGGFVSRTSADGFPKPNSGERYFWAGEKNYSCLYQDVDLSQSAGLIDGGGLVCNFGGWIQSFNRNDEPSLRLDLLDARGALLQTCAIGPVKCDAWYPFQQSCDVPTGTRGARLYLESIRRSGSINDGFFDDLFLSCMQEKPPSITASIITGPYLQNATPSSIVVMWETDRPAPSGVYVRNASQTDWTQFYDPAQVRMHEITVTGVLPEQRYEYKVASSGAESPIYSFRTGFGIPFRLGVWGDSRTSPANHRRVISGMIQWSPDIAVNVGDVVASGGNYAEWQAQHFSPIQPLGGNVTTYIAIGNHEGNSHWFDDYVCQPGNEHFFAFTYANCRFIVLDTNWPYGPGSPQYEWLLRELSSDECSLCTFRFAFFHHPPYSEMWDSPGYVGETGVRTYLAPLLERAKVDIVFNGHTHDYERGKLPSAGEQGTYYVITGGGGAPLDTVETYDWEHVVIHRSLYHFCIIDVEADRLTLKAIDVDGNIVDSFSIDKSRNALPDLEVSSVSVQPSIPAPGTQAWVQAEVRNTGNAPCPDFRVGLCANQSCILNQPESGIPPGGKRTIRLPWSPAREGTWVLNISLDPQNLVDEGIYEYDNAAAIRCLVCAPQPDIALESMGMTPTSASVRPGENATFHIGVRNTGSARSASFEVQVVLEGGTSVRTLQFPALEVGESATRSASEFAFPLQGAHVVRVDLDPGNQVQEISEQNSYSYTVWVAQCVQKGPAYVSKALVENNAFLLRYDDSIGELGPRALAVSLVWGIDGWREPPSSIRPRGTSTRWGVTETPMERGIDGLWTLAIPVGGQANQVDFLFKTAVLDLLSGDDNDGRPWRWVSPMYYTGKLSEMEQLMTDSRTWNLNLSQYSLAADLAASLAEDGDYAAAASVVEENTNNLGFELVGLMATQAKARSDAAKQLGLDVRNVETFLRAAQSHLTLGNWRTARNYVDSAVRALEKLDEPGGPWQKAVLLLLALPLLGRPRRRIRSEHPNPGQS